MNIHSITDILFPMIQKIDLAPLRNSDSHIEAEFRFGKFNGNMFDTNVGKTAHDYIMRGLSKYTSWDRIVSSDEEVFYRDSDGVRISIDSTTGEETVIRKDRITKHDLKHIGNNPFDIRFSISSENPVTGEIEGDMDKKKTKKRVSFFRKNLSIDMTIVSGDSHDMDSEDPVSYQVEFEILDLEAVNTKDDLFKILHKINDIFIMLGTNK
jgi:hypothetical protein